MLKRAYDSANDEKLCTEAGVSKQSLLLKKPYRLLLKLDYARAMQAVSNGKSYRSEYVKWFYANSLLQEPDSMGPSTLLAGESGRLFEALATRDVEALKSDRLSATKRGSLANCSPTSQEANDMKSNSMKLHESVKTWIDVHMHTKKVPEYQKPLVSASTFEHGRAEAVDDALNSLEGCGVLIHFTEF